jgi:hypothetical protein
VDGWGWGCLLLAGHSKHNNHQLFFVQRATGTIMTFVATSMDITGTL